MTKIRLEIQVTSTECGLCCVAMLLRAMGCTDTTAKIRAELDLGRDGATVQQLKDTFERRGVPTRIYRANTVGLSKLDGPAICFWGDYHFVIVERMTADQVSVIDPAAGRSRMSIEEFDAGFSGIVIHPEQVEAASLHPVPDRRHRSSLRTLFVGAAKEAWLPLFAMVLCAVVSYAGMLALPILTQRLIDAAITSPDRSLWFTKLPLVLAACIVAFMIANYARAVALARSTVLIGRRTAEAVLSHLLHLPYKFFDTRQPGELSYRLAGLAAIRDIVSGQMVTGLFEIGAATVFLGYLFHTSTVLGGVGLAMVAVTFLLLFGTRARVATAIQNEIVQIGKSQTQQLEAIQSILTIKASGSSGFFLSRWKNENDAALRYLGIRTRLQGGVNAIVGGIQVGAPLLILMTGLQLWSDGTLTLGTVVACQAIAISLFGSASSIYGAVTQLMMVTQYGKRLQDILDTTPERDGDRAASSWAPLQLTDVSYRYTRQSPQVLRHVDLTVRPGEKVAIVGPTGSGKSTLARLILGLYEPESGDVRFAGEDLRQLERSSVLKEVAFVPQGVTLETMSVRRNITMGQDVSDEELVRACDRACISRDIEDLPMGYETLVSNLGDNFSGGQKQRLGIARALVRKPRLLVLDEATSSLDHATETAIMGAINDMDCAAVIIAHRLASVVAADRIYVLDRGEVVEAGTHHELISRRGTYWTMFGSQLQESGERLVG